MKNILLLSALVISFNLDAQTFNIIKDSIEVNDYTRSLCKVENSIYFLDSRGDNAYKIDLTTKAIDTLNCNIELDYLINYNNTLIAYNYKNKPYYYTGTKFERYNKKIKQKPFFEDKQYLVETLCNGEWGGEAWFTDKRTKKKYACEATCPFIINKINNTYYLTTSLLHLTAFTAILEINDPSSLPLYQKRRNISEHPDRLPISPDSPNRTVIDSVGFMTMTSFVYNEELYHIGSKVDYLSPNYTEATNLYKVTKNELVLIEKIANFNMMTDEIIITESGEQTCYFSKELDNGGILWIKDNNIHVFSLNKKKEHLN
ncbi:hypothetical protein [Dysgonomonas sp. 25]|uniref:hypothetical protein n=1 Tax=Dysgonomonas sp. 25 TaxID=2302933 RepID=UPI0013D2F2EA|nr:hypothetical protein [Dysgonomonas sp. 25]NDV69889.1 hypothetical protein [Dysgonomonas sp. 25]